VDEKGIVSGMNLGMRFFCDAFLNLCISGLFLKEKKGQNSEELIIVTFLQKKKSTNLTCMCDFKAFLSIVAAI